MENSTKKFGTAPVFFTAISTILGAILFLRFGFAVGSVGLVGVLLLIVLGHLVTIPTALAISELATNKRVEGGGEYFIISRSFGLNIGATIGIALFLSQAISVAFYVIAFTEAFSFLFDYYKLNYGLELPRQVVSLPVMFLLSLLILKKGANLGVKALYVVVFILAISIILFFAGNSGYSESNPFDLSKTELIKTDNFFLVFAIIFPAFTGMTAGVGLSGDLRNPGKSIPFGTVAATLIGMVVYVFVSFKLANSASPEELKNNQFVMADIAVWGWLVVPIGLAASTISSALGSVMVAPRTLNALAGDSSFPFQSVNKWLSKVRAKDDEPVNASLITCVIAFVFVAMGDVDAVARIISMFFMITYGSLSLISFLHHFGSSPSYRPSFKSKWYISLLGFVTAVWVMFKIDSLYSFIAISVMILLYIYMDYYHKHRRGLSSIFANTIFQLNRALQLFLQSGKVGRENVDWKPSAICISKNSFERDNAFRLLNWISYKYGFGTYLHRIEGLYSAETNQQAEEELTKLISYYGHDSHVYIDTIISPSYTSAIAQSIQIPGISGMENNMIILEFDKDNPVELSQILSNYKIINSGNFDICILGSSRKPIIFKNGIHVWIRTTDENNANLMIILSYIMLGHPDWKKSDIKIFQICRPDEYQNVLEQMEVILTNGRLPITNQNIHVLVNDQDEPEIDIINRNSSDAGLTIVGFKEKDVEMDNQKLFVSHQNLGNVLFVNSNHNMILE